MTDYSKMTPEEFQAILEDIVGRMGPLQVLAVPGVDEVLREEFNNDVLDQWALANHGKAYPEGSGNRFVCESCDTEYNTQEELDDCVEAHIDETEATR